MPVYVYKCNECDFQFEEFQSVDDKKIEKCKQKGCTGSVRKVFTPISIQFKGSGFYKTDN